jgi:hypothetical protein
MSEQEQASLLAQWLDQSRSEEGIDVEVQEAVLTLRPDLAPAPQLTIDDILDEVSEGPFLDGGPREDIDALLHYLEKRPGEAPPDDVDPEVLEAVIALRPDLAPKPTVDLAEILEGVSQGPLSSSKDEGDNLVSLGSTRRSRSPGRIASVSFALLTAAAVALVAVKVLEAPTVRSDRSDSRDEVALSEDASDDESGDQTPSKPASENEEAKKHALDGVKKERQQSAPEPEESEAIAGRSRLEEDVAPPSPSAEAMESGLSTRGRSDSAAWADAPSDDADMISGVGVTGGAPEMEMFDQEMAEFEADSSHAEDAGYGGLSGTVDGHASRPASARSGRPISTPSSGDSSMDAHAKDSSPRVRLVTIDESIRSRIEGYLSQIQACVDGSGIQPNDSQRVLLNLSLEILDHRGHSAAVQFSGSRVSLASQQQLKPCIQDKAVGWSFPSHEDSGPFEVVYEISP